MFMEGWLTMISATTLCFELDDDAHPVAVRLVAQIGDPFDFFSCTSAAICSISRVLLTIRDFADDDLLFAGPFDRFGKSLPRIWMMPLPLV